MAGKTTLKMDRASCSSGESVVVPGGELIVNDGDYNIVNKGSSHNEVH